MTLLTMADFKLKGTRTAFYGEYLNTLDGWEDGVTMRRDSRPIPQNHGEFDVPAFMEARTVPFTASFYARSRQELALRGRRFTTLLAQGNARKVSIELDGTTLWGMARQGDRKPTWRREPGHLAIARASMELFFPDPRRYGDPVLIPPAAVGDSFRVFQHGTFPAVPVFTITGVMPGGYAINMGNRQFRVTAPLVFGQTHVIDMTYGTVSINGTVRLRVTPRADTWAIPPGMQVIHSVVPLTTGDGVVKTAVRSTH